MIVVAPVIIGAISLAVVSFASIQTSSSDRLAANSDAQVIAAHFNKDVASANFFTTPKPPIPPPTTLPACGTGTQLIGFEWTASATTNTIVSYNLTSLGTTPFGITEFQFVRNECTWAPALGFTATLSSSTTLSSRVAGAPAPKVTVLGESCSSPSISSCSYNVWYAAWANSTGITSIQLDLSEASVNSKSVDKSCSNGIVYCFSVRAAPREWFQLGSSTGPVGNTLPAQFLGTGTDISACSSNNPNVMVNGYMMLDSTGPNSITQNGSPRNNIYAAPVQWLKGGTPPDPNYLGTGVQTQQVDTSVPDPLAGLTAPNFSNLPTFGDLASATLAVKTSGGTTYRYLLPGTYTFALADSTDPAPAVLVLSSGQYDLTQGIGAVTVQSGVGGNLVYIPTNGSGAINGSTGLNLWPMSTGPYAGLTMWLPNQTATRLAASNFEINGLVYMPNGVWGGNGDYKMWIGSLLSLGTSCSGGGNGQVDIAFTQSLAFTSTPSPNNVVGDTYTVSASDTVTPAQPSTSPYYPYYSAAPTLTPTYSVDPLSTPGACTHAGATFTFTGVGVCLVDANQPGTSQDASVTPPIGGYAAAPTIQQFILVTAAG